MLDFLKDIILWLWKKIAYIFLPVIGWTVWLYENAFSLWNSAWEWVFSSVKWYFCDFYSWFFSKITALATTFFAGNDFVVSVAGFADTTFTAINVFIPLNEGCACATLVVTTMVAVFIIRFVLKAVPTVW